MRCNDDGQWPTSGYTPCDTGESCDPAENGCYCAHTMCSGQRCADLNSDPQHCGDCDVTCPGPCVGGACGCATQSPSNLVPNGGFDLAISGWDIRSDPALSITRATLDAANCPSSGSLHMTYQSEAAGTGYFVTGPCVPVDPSLTYNIGGWIYVPKASVGNASFSVTYYPDSECKTISGTSTGVTVGIVTVFDTWKQVHAESVTPTPGSKAAQLRIQLSSSKTGLEQAYFDALYVTRTPGGF